MLVTLLRCSAFSTMLRCSAFSTLLRCSAFSRFALFVQSVITCGYQGATLLTLAPKRRKSRMHGHLIRRSLGSYKGLLLFHLPGFLLFLNAF